MAASDTDPAVMVLISLAVAVTLLAWWLSARNDRKTRRLIAHVKQHHGSYWQSLPRLSRILNPVGAVEAYRRSAQPADPIFLALYQERRRGRRIELTAITVAGAIIAIVIVGTTLLGWQW